jgi:type IV secretion system protein VirD4
MLILAVLIAASVAAIVMKFYPGVLFLVIVGVAWRGVIASRGHSTAHGSARWAVPGDIMPMLLEGDGLILGHMHGQPSWTWKLRSLLSLRLSAGQACQRFLAREHVVRLNDACHIAIFAPTGRGKGVSVVVPHLLTCRDSSLVVVDFKGENYRLTARARLAMGHRVVPLDPYWIATREPDTFNPLEFLDKDSPHVLDECRDIAAAFVVRTGAETDKHWSDSAEIWLTAMIAFVVAYAKGEDKCLHSVRELLTDSKKMEAAITVMCASDEMDGMLARLGHQLEQFKDRERASTLTTVNRFLRFLDTPAITDCTRRSTFSPADLLTGKMTIYLVLPPDRARALSALVRMWVGSFLRAVVQGGLQETTKVRFILDEAATLGHLEAIDDAVDKLRGYGVRLVFLYQSLGQLKKCFPDGQEQTLLSNVSQTFFGVQDQQTAEYVSSRLGETTITTESGGTTYGTSTQHSAQGASKSTNTGTNHNWQYMGRKLLKPEEVTGLDERVAITFVPGVPPIATRLIRYYEKEFQNLSGVGPLRMALRVLWLFIAVVFFALIILNAVLPHVSF